MPPSGPALTVVDASRSAITAASRAITSAGSQAILVDIRGVMASVSPVSVHVPLKPLQPAVPLTVVASNTTVTLSSVTGTTAPVPLA